MAGEKCVFCGVKLRPTTVTMKGLKLEGLKCPKCEDKVFNEKQFGSALAALEQKRLKDNYSKKPIKIGHSYGMTFPKDIVHIFNLDSKKTKLNIKPDIAKSKIEISVS